MALHSFLILATLDHTYPFTTPLCLCVSHFIYSDIRLSTTSLRLLLSIIRILLTTTSLSSWSLFLLPFTQNLYLSTASLRLLSLSTIRIPLWQPLRLRGGCSSFPFTQKLCLSLLLWNMYLISFTQNIWLSIASLCSLRWTIRMPLRHFFVFVYLIPLAQINKIRSIFNSRLN